MVVLGITFNIPSKNRVTKKLERKAKLAAAKKGYELRLKNGQLAVLYRSDLPEIREVKQAVERVGMEARVYGGSKADRNQYALEIKNSDQPVYLVYHKVNFDWLIGKLLTAPVEETFKGLKCVVYLRQAYTRHNKTGKMILTAIIENVSPNIAVLVRG